MTWTPQIGDRVVVMAYRVAPSRASLYDGQVIERTDDGDGVLVRFEMGGMDSIRAFEVDEPGEAYLTPDDQWLTSSPSSRAGIPACAVG